MGLDSIFGNFGMAEQHKGAAAVTRANARIARAQGKAARGKAYGQANRIEASNKVAGQQVVENMERVQKNATLARGEVRAVRGASGVNDSGSGSRAEQSVLERYEQATHDMASSRSLQDLSARFQASMSRKSGDIAEMSGEADYEYGLAQAGMQEQMAKNAKHAGIAQIVAMVGGGLVGGIAGGGLSAGIRGAMNAGGAMSTMMSGTPGTYESRNQTVAGDMFSKFAAEQMSSWLS